MFNFKFFQTSLWHDVRYLTREHFLTVHYSRHITCSKQFHKKNLLTMKSSDTAPLYM